MSLVVAEATEDGPRIVSDTRFVFSEGSKSSFRTGTLKAVVLHPDVAVCFAGDVVAGLKGVRGSAKKLNEGDPVDALITPMQTLSSDRKRSVEFIVANSGGGSQLTRFRDGVAERSLLIACIGDPHAFERFQRERHTPPDAASRLVDDVTSILTVPQKTMHSLQMAMRVVIDDPTIDSVNDFCVAAAHGPKGFTSLSSIFIQVGRDIQVHGDFEVISTLAEPVEDES